MRMNVGEIRQVGIEVYNLANQDFVISQADYTIKDAQRREIEKGFPTIDGHKIFALFKAEKTGKYEMEFSYLIDPEVLKAKVMIEVM